MIAALGGTIGPYVEAYGKSWQKADEESQREQRNGQVLWLWEDALELGNSVFGLVERRIDEWRRAVASGAITYDERSNQVFQETLRQLLEPEGLARGVIARLAKESGAVKGAEAFLDHCDRARKALNAWVPPVLSGARGLHVWDLDDEEAAELDGVLERAAARTGPSACR
jgi:hypothetical protein